MVRQSSDQREGKERDDWDGSKVVIAFVTFLLLLLLAIVLSSSADGGPDMNDMSTGHAGVDGS